MAAPILEESGVTLRTNRKSRIWLFASGIKKGDKVKVKVEGTEEVLWHGDVDRITGNKARATLQLVVDSAYFKSLIIGGGDVIDIDVTVTNHTTGDESPPVTNVAIIDGP